ncbi:unnamed protein product [Mycena citricolor]|uniref:Acetyl-CoA synthetase-like protein n=1 Tax=Mycena citricolor TaxID=2018698 RepID=A0AAD2K452_9AGAR|nr:unnamed protein product [Mycena citricolor]
MDSRFDSETIELRRLSTRPCQTGTFFTILRLHDPHGAATAGLAHITRFSHPTMASSTWVPQRSVAETQAILDAPESLLETETRVIDNKVQRVYKKLWPTIRDFWLWSAARTGNADKTYVVFEKQRYTYQQMFDRSVKAAAVFRDVYGIKKGDKVAICSRNNPEYLVAFWACHFLGAITVLVNAWLPTTPLLHCFTLTECKLVMLDAERADLLEPVVKQLGAAGTVVIDSHEGKGSWDGMASWNAVMDRYTGDARSVLATKVELLPEDDAVIFFTSVRSMSSFCFQMPSLPWSQTTGLPKGVLSTHRQYMTNTLTVRYPLCFCVTASLHGQQAFSARARCMVRRGEAMPVLDPNASQQVMLAPSPFFHVVGVSHTSRRLSFPGMLTPEQLTTLVMIGTFSGAKLVLIRKWNVKEAIRLAVAENVTYFGGVPSLSADIIESELSKMGIALDTLALGGAAVPAELAKRAHAAFPILYYFTHPTGCRYGLTETNGAATLFSGEDYVARPDSCGVLPPVGDVLIVKDGKAVPHGQLGEIWLRGPNIMKGYYRDPGKLILTGDVGMQDEEGFIYIRDRIKDIIIRGGENVDSTTVENALFLEGVLEVAAVGVPDKRLGELVTAFVALKDGFEGRWSEQTILAAARTKLPSFAVPVMILFKNDLPHNAAGKIVKSDLREIAAKEWLNRSAGRAATAKL